MFETHEFDDLMEWRVCNWTIPGNIECIIRCENTKTGRIKEYVYKQATSATKKIAELAEQEHLILTVATDDAILVCPQTSIPNIKKMLNTFDGTELEKYR